MLIFHSYVSLSEGINQLFSGAKPNGKPRRFSLPPEPFKAMRKVGERYNNSVHMVDILLVFLFFNMMLTNIDFNSFHG